MHLPQHALNRLAAFFLLAFAALALVTGYWSLVRREPLTSRDDNPRLVLAEQRMRRGAIIDRNGQLLAYTEGAPGDYERVYPVSVAAPVVGYASITYGVSGVERLLNAELRGEAGRSARDLWWRHTVLHEPPTGRSVQLTIDGDLQIIAAAALEPYAGAVVVLESHSGAVLAMASLPTFDANTLDADWQKLITAESAPLYNRATFGLYQPGTALQPALISAALNADVLSDATNMPDEERLTALLHTLGPDQLASVLRDFGLLEPPDFKLPVRAADQEVVERIMSDPARLVAGTSELVVTPLQMARVAATLANDGARPELQLISALETDLGMWEPYPQFGQPHAVLPSKVVGQLESMLRATTSSDMSGMIGYSATAKQRESDQSLGWFIGYSDDRSLAVAVVVEDGSGEVAYQVAQAITVRCLNRNEP